MSLQPDVEAPLFAVIGEAVIDLVEKGDDEPRLAYPGGGPYNVAIGLARLGRHARFAGRISRDPLGIVLHNHAARSDVDLSWCLQTDEPSTVALVELSADGVAEYRFGIDGTADFRWTDDELQAIDAGADLVHFGSLTSWLAPGDAAVARRIAELRTDGVLITYDPNVRPHLQPDPEVARGQVEGALPLAHLVKTSEADLDYLYPGRAITDVAAAWLSRGPSLVIVTRGENGVSAFGPGGAIDRAPHAIQLVDTVGAGDAFTAGLLDALATHDLLTADAIARAGREPATQLTDVLDHAGLVAAITCSRAGANPPRRADLDAPRR